MALILTYLLLTGSCHINAHFYDTVLLAPFYESFNADSIKKVMAPYNKYKKIDISVTDDDVVVGNRNLKSLVKDEGKVADMFEWLDWNVRVHNRKTDAYELRTPSNKYYIITADVLGGSGLAANFRVWEIINGGTGDVITFSSMSMEPEFIFFNPEVNKMQYIEVRHGEYYHVYSRAPGSDNIDFEIVVNEINGKDVKETKRFYTRDKTFLSTVE
jgi:hypothetical protein